MGRPYWPLFDLEVRTPRLTLRYVDDDLAIELAALAARGIHDPATMPFCRPWTDVPSPELERNSLRFWWRSRAELTTSRWELTFAVLEGGDGDRPGRVLGGTGLSADDFPTLRSFETGSWLGLEHQGRGLGRELREATLHLGFDVLGAEFATTTAFVDNAPSLGVTRGLGYEPDGTHRVVRRGEPAELLRFRMPRAHWETIRRADITVHGADAVPPFLGLA